MLQDTLHDIASLLDTLRAASANSPAALKAFAENATVNRHVKALGRIVGVAMKCAFALEKFGAANGQHEELYKSWRKLIVSGGWRAESGAVEAKEGVFSEPKCAVCWNFIGPLDTVACISGDVPNHLFCANLCVNRYPNKAS